MSWVPGYKPLCDFSIHNIPFGVFSTGQDPRPRCCTAIGSNVVDLELLYEAGLLANVEGLNHNVFKYSRLNQFMELSRVTWQSTRRRLQELLVLESSDIIGEKGINGISPDPSLQENHDIVARAVLSIGDVVLHLPVEVREYTDFYCSREHATNVGIMFRGHQNALQPNWLHLPVGYHGRASSIVVSGTPVIRPRGQILSQASGASTGSQEASVRHTNSGTVTFSSTEQLDFELEIGALLGGPSNAQGQSIDMSSAEERIFGIVLLNDWSARDIQAWEYVPLGPFTSKNFCTSISPWVVTLDALEAFRCSSSAGPEQSDPCPLPYLRDPNYHSGSYDICLEVSSAVRAHDLLLTCLFVKRIGEVSCGGRSQRGRRTRSHQGIFAVED